MKQLILCFLALIGSFSLYGINVRISGIELLDTVDGGVRLELLLSWDNSWNDELNHDGVYVFGKYQGSDDVWHTMHFSLSDVDVVSEGYRCDSLGIGFLLRRSVLGSGRSEVRLRLVWRCSREDNAVSAVSVLRGEVAYSVEGMEMVYVPSYPFYAVGEGFDSPSFSILPSHLDLIGSSSSFTYSSSRGGVASHVADRVNDAFYSPSHSHNWYSVAPCWWRVDFKSPRRILYFGVSSLWNSNTYPGGEWYLLGSNDAVKWDTLWSGGVRYWNHSRTSYPVQQSLRVENSGSYRYYEVSVPTVDSLRAPYWGDVYLMNVAMTESDLSASSGSGGKGVLIDGSLGCLPGSYPSGHGGFYAMKYELTQEQYVSFLNKLSPSGQYVHTVGGRLDGIGEGEYVFGEEVSSPSHRNGIVVKRRPLRSGDRYVFGCRLTPGVRIDSALSGGMVACNYLSVEDMLSYACWSGLRPLSELEYEKMCLRPYPWGGSSDDYAFGGGSVVFGKGLLSEGTEKERFSEGNVNGGNAGFGPVRVGMFERRRGAGGSSSVGSSSGSGGGSSFWGIDGLSGNVEEIYSNAEVYGRDLDGGVHGRGELDGFGRSVMPLTGWGSVASGYGARGGSYASDEAGLRVGDRRHALDYFSSLAERKSTVGFRLGHSVPPRRYDSRLLLENGQGSMTGGVAYDTVCRGGVYVIAGSEGEGKGSVYSWYCSVDGGKSWELVSGATKRDLVLRNLTDSVGRDELRRYRYRRLVSDGVSFSESGDVELLVGWGYRLDRLRDTLQPCHESRGFTVRSVLSSDYRWKCLDTGRELLEERNTRESHCGVRSADFLEGGKWEGGRYTLELEVNVLGRCLYRERLHLEVVPYTDSPFSGDKESFVYSGNIHRVENLWSGKDRQGWRLLNEEVGTLRVDSLGVLRGVDSTLCSHILVEAVCADFPDKTYKKEVYEGQRNYSYRSNYYTLTLLPGSYTIECFGAQGGTMQSGWSGVGGQGGRAKGNIDLTVPKTLYLYVGSQGEGYNSSYANHMGGWNGGGDCYQGASGGGGATDIRLEGGAWNDVKSLRSRIMVAGGGGGSNDAQNGGAGGGLTGGTGVCSSGSAGTGGTQTQGGGGWLSGTFGRGAGVVNNYGDGGAGGGGYYGGGKANGHTCAGGGGSGFVSGLTGCNAVNSSGSHTGQPHHYSGLSFYNASLMTGGHTGHGLVRITVKK